VHKHSKQAGNTTRTAADSTTAVTQNERPEPGIFASIRDWFAGLRGTFITAAFAAVAILQIPRVPLSADVDSSWSGVLGFAWEKGLQFGKDIVFTFGPLGFLTTTFYTPHAAGIRMVAQVGLAFVVALGVCLVAARLTNGPRIAVITLLIFLCCNSNPGTDLLINVGLLSWGLVCALETDKVRRIGVPCLVVLAGFAVLEKLTFFLSASATIAACSLLMCLAGQRKLAIGTALGFCVLFVLGWIISGQDLTSLPAFFRNALLISSGYDQTMALEVSSTFQARGKVAVVLTVAIILIRSLGAWAGGPFLWWRRLVLLLWLVITVFVAWKRGFVRAGSEHMSSFLGLVPILVLTLGAIPLSNRRATLVARYLGFAACLVSVLTMTSFFPNTPGYWLKRPFQQFALNAQACTIPRSYLKRMNEFYDAQKSAMQLPRIRRASGTNSVDVFGYEQVYALLNDLNFTPRPVFQSYAAYRPSLMRMNRDWYLSGSAPSNVLFRLEAIDRRFPPMEDALTLTHLLANYEPVEAEGRFLLLESRRRQTVSLSLLSEATLEMGDRIDLRPYGNVDLWLAITVEPSFAGRLRRVLFKAPRLLLAAYPDLDGSQPVRFTAPAPMLEAGFLASPLLLDNEDVLQLYTGSTIRRPAAFAVVPAHGTDHFWSERIRFSLYRVDTTLGRSVPRELDRLTRFPGFKLAPIEFLSNSNAVFKIHDAPAVLLPPGGYMRFPVTPGVRSVSGGFGFAPLAYLFGGETAGAEFRIEQQFPDGTRIQLLSRFLNPLTRAEDRGLMRFNLPLPREGGSIAFRTLAGPATNAACDLSCWAEISLD
jgi:hypothetical protein